MEAGAVLRSADPGELPHGHKEEAGGSYLISGIPILFLWKLGSSSLEPHYNNGDNNAQSFSHIFWGTRPVKFSPA